MKIRKRHKTRVKVHKMSSQNPTFSFDICSTDEGDVREPCPCCKLPFSEHTNSQLVKCALTELKGGKKKN